MALELALEADTIRGFMDVAGEVRGCMCLGLFGGAARVGKRWPPNAESFQRRGEGERGTDVKKAWAFFKVEEGRASREM